MLNKNRNLYSLIASMSILFFSADALASNSNSKSTKKQLLTALSVPSQIAVERTVDGTNFIGDMADAAAALKSYSFDYETMVFKGSKVIDQQGNFYFKAPPRMFRVEMTGSYKRGAVAVMGKDGKVRGHLGGALSGFTINIDPSSDMLVGANGYPLMDSDFASMAGVIKKFLAQGCKSKVTEHPVSVEGQTKKVYVLELTRPGATELYKRAYVDPQSLLPVEWFDYKDGRLFAHTVWTDLKFDVALKDDVFKI